MMIDRIAAIAALSVAIGLPSCGGGPSMGTVQTASRDEPQLANRLNAIAERLRELGYDQPVWTDSGELGPGEHRTASLTVDEVGRMVLVVIGDTAGANLDISVIGPRGTVEAADESADHRAAVEFATSAHTEYRVTVTNSSPDTTSRYLSRAFRAGPSTEPAPLFGLFDNDLQSAPSWDEVEIRVAALGMSEGSLARTVGAARGERLDERIELEAGRCYLFVAQGSAGIDSVAIRLSQRDALLVADLAGRSTAWVRHCAESELEVKLSVEVLAGSGRVRIASFSADREDLDPVLVGPPLSPREPPLTIDAAIRWTDQQLARAGYDPAEIQFEGELGEGERKRRTVRLEAGECAVFSATSGPGVHDLDLEIRDPGGDLVSGDSSMGPTALARYCSPEAGDHEVSIVGRAGAGTAVMMVSRLPRIELPTSRVDPPRGAYEAAAVFGRCALDPVSEITPVTRIEEDDKAAWSARVELDRNRCYGVCAAVDGATIERLELRSPEGESAALWKRDGLPATVTACATASGRYEVRVVLSSEGDGVAPLLLLFGSTGAAPTSFGSS